MGSQEHQGVGVSGVYWGLAGTLGTWARRGIGGIRCIGVPRGCRGCYGGIRGIRVKGVSGVYGGWQGV